MIPGSNRKFSWNSSQKKRLHGILEVADKCFNWLVLSDRVIIGNYFGRLCSLWNLLTIKWRVGGDSVARQNRDRGGCIIKRFPERRWLRLDRQLRQAQCSNCTKLTEGWVISFNSLFVHFAAWRRLCSQTLSSTSGPTIICSFLLKPRSRLLILAFMDHSLVFRFHKISLRGA